MTDQPSTDASLTLERTFAATPEELWAAWTDPAQYAKWLNPAPDHDLVIHEFDVRPGGKVRFDMPQPDGNKNPQEGVFHVLEPHERIVSGEPDKSFLIEVRFIPVDDEHTRMVVEVTGLPPEYQAPATEGWNAGFDKLETVVGAATERAITISRTIDAPREDVFAAFADADVLGTWWGPDGFTTTTKAFEFEEGGVWEFVMHGPDGTDHPNHIEFREIDRPNRLVYDHRSSGAHPGGFQSTVTLVGTGKGTLITLQMVFPSGDDRDETAKGGAAEGGEQTLARLAGLVEG